ncbi:probable protein phosphatase 2C 6 [Lycium ferocissimum]|uniref:probable protein phosphatase 2C 6 n=1 Tax=Lycium ferocissimum TaxID=112874 RepID=UPI002816870D|nr:probable protein phosphatase 2C 6 [Lycium ferocissimum]
MGICYSSSKGKSSEKECDGKNESKMIDLKLRKSSSSSNGDFSTFISKLSGGGGSGVIGVEERGLEQIPGRLIENGGSGVACLYTQQGKKGINQDAMIVWENYCSRSDTILCGVYDGHGPHGHMVARKVRDYLPILLRSEWETKSCGDQNAVSENGHTNGGSHFDDIVDDDLVESVEAENNEKFPEIHLPLKRSMLRAFRSMDKELKLHPSIDCFCSGSTAVTLVMQGQDIFVGNVGDSRAVLATRDKDNSLMAVQLTVDLKPNLPREAARIHKCKGRVFALQDEPEVARVWLPNCDSPGLAMARAFGDFCLKDFGLISVPDVYYHHITEGDEFVLLATDGVWDVLSNKEAVDIVASAPSRATAGRALVDCATRAWRLKYPTSKNDDCAVVCLYLDTTPVPDVKGIEGQNKLTNSPEVEIKTNTIDGNKLTSSPEVEIKTITTDGNKLTNSPEMEIKTNTIDGNVRRSDTEAISTSQTVGLEDPNTTKDDSEIVPVVESLEEQHPGKGLGQSKRSIAEFLSTAQDDEWSALEGITRVNSLLSIPRFLSAEKRSNSWRRKWL